MLKILANTSMGEQYENDQMLISLIEFAQIKDVSEPEMTKKLPKLKKKLAETEQFDLMLHGDILRDTKELLFANKNVTYDEAYLLCKTEMFNAYGVH